MVNWMITLQNLHMHAANFAQSGCLYMGNTWDACGPHNDFIRFEAESVENLPTSWSIGHGSSDWLWFGHPMQQIAPFGVQEVEMLTKNGGNRLARGDVGYFRNPWNGAQTWGWKCGHIHSFWPTSWERSRIHNTNTILGSWHSDGTIRWAGYVCPATVFTQSYQQNVLGYANGRRLEEDTPKLTQRLQPELNEAWRRMDGPEESCEYGRNSELDCCDDSGTFARKDGSVVKCCNGEVECTMEFFLDHPDLHVFRDDFVPESETPETPESEAPESETSELEAPGQD